MRAVFPKKTQVQKKKDEKEEEETIYDPDRSGTCLSSLLNVFASMENGIIPSKLNLMYRKRRGTNWPCVMSEREEEIMFCHAVARRFGFLGSLMGYRQDINQEEGIDKDQGSLYLVFSLRIHTTHFFMNVSHMFRSPLKNRYSTVPYRNLSAGVGILRQFC